MLGCCNSTNRCFAILPSWPSLNTGNGSSVLSPCSSLTPMPILDHSFFLSLAHLQLTLTSSFRLPPAQTTQTTTHHPQRRTLLPTIPNPQPCLLLNRGPGKTSFLLHIPLLHPGGSVQPERLTASRLLGRAELGSPVKPPSNHHHVSQRPQSGPDHTRRGEDHLFVWVHRNPHSILTTVYYSTCKSVYTRYMVGRLPV